MSEGEAHRSTQPGFAPKVSVICSVRFDTNGDRVDPKARAIRVAVRVELKPGVMDAEAASIQKSLSLLGIRSIARVATARIYELEFTGVTPREATRLAIEAVDRLLANPVIHRVTIGRPSG